tara:strand:+ start:277 stop:492 length:216 start_codon:yes stop_codon:yes gene_type:complete
MTEKSFLKFYPDIVNGICPTCNEMTMLVGLTKDYYRCMTCGEDLKQHINGKISYLPIMDTQVLSKEELKHG